MYKLLSNFTNVLLDLFECFNIILYLIGPGLAVTKTSGDGIVTPRTLAKFRRKHHLREKIPWP